LVEPREFSFDERLRFSVGQRAQDDMATIAGMLHDCYQVMPASRDQQRHGVDYVATLFGGAEILIDAKARDSGCSYYWKKGEPDLALEIWSVMPDDGVRERVGWTLSQALMTDLVLFTFDPADHAQCYLLSFPLLRNAFAQRRFEWAKSYGTHKQHTDGRYRSECVFVPLSVVRRAIESASVGIRPKIVLPKAIDDRGMLPGLRLGDMP
jgi:hypothetical protein